MGQGMPAPNDTGAQYRVPWSSRLQRSVPLQSSSQVQARAHRPRSPTSGDGKVGYTGMRQRVSTLGTAQLGLAPKTHPSWHVCPVLQEPRHRSKFGLHCAPVRAKLPLGLTAQRPVRRSHVRPVTQSSSSLQRGRQISTSTMSRSGTTEHARSRRPRHLVASPSPCNAECRCRNPASPGRSSRRWDIRRRWRTPWCRSRPLGLRPGRSLASTTAAARRSCWRRTRRGADRLREAYRPCRRRLLRRRVPRRFRPRSSCWSRRRPRWWSWSCRRSRPGSHRWR